MKVPICVRIEVGLQGSAKSERSSQAIFQKRNFKSRRAQILGRFDAVSVSQGGATASLSELVVTCECTSTLVDALVLLLDANAGFS